MKYIKKPVVVEAHQTDKELVIETLEGAMHASVGDYIITGVSGEQYPCKPDIFKKTYEMVKDGVWLEQPAKDDQNKPKLTLVPQQIIWDIAEVREYGNKKYGDPDNWKTVEKERYRDAAYRHFLKYLADPDGVDEESGISHLKHLACNIAFLCELEST